MRRESVAERLATALGVRVRAVRPEGCWGWEWECEDGRVVRKYAAAVLDYDGYSDSKFDTYYSADGGWTRIFI